MLAVVVLYWSWLIGSTWLELTTFTRFITRLAASALLLLVFVVWWWTNRRIRLGDRALVFGVAVLGGVVVAPLCHPAVGGFGLLMGPGSIVLTMWLLCLLVTRRASPRVRRLALLGTIALCWAYQPLVRIDGLSGDLRPEIHWRWTPTPEDLFLAEIAEDSGKYRPAASAKSALVLGAGDWPGFRGPNRDGIVQDACIRTDWNDHPPRLLWRHRVGPAWSSLALVGGRLFTQEQRGEHEAVVCYDADTGKEVWEHRDEGRFWEPTAGVGPKATPCFAQGRLFSLGASGILNCLDAATGKKHWSHDIKDDSGAAVPQWSYSGSPLVVGDLVIVFAGGAGSQNLLAYRVNSGDLAWTASCGQSSYSSPHLARIAGEPQLLMLSNRGLTAVDPPTGAVLWEHEVALPPSAPRSVQPNVLTDGVLIASEGDLGLARLDVKRKKKEWAAEQRWATLQFKPAFNDFVVHQGHVYGFDGRIFGCVDVETSERRWKKGRYGQGQVLLLREQALLLVVSETGKAILLRAIPERHEELGRFQALEGKTWNHPVLAHGRLYLRNAEEMACYELRPLGPP
jgi:outer membrane protein assembly factor BamB